MRHAAHDAGVRAIPLALLVAGLALPAGSSELQEIDARFVMAFSKCSTRLSAPAELHAVFLANCDDRVVVATSRVDSNPFSTFEPTAERAWQESEAGSDARWAIAYCKPDKEVIRVSVGILRNDSTEKVEFGAAWYLDDSTAELKPFDGSTAECNPILRAAAVFGPRIACFAADRCSFYP